MMNTSTRDDADLVSLLCTFTGPDQPGVTTSLLAAMPSEVHEVLDAEQTVIRGKLTLSLVISTDADAATELPAALAPVAAQFGLRSEFVADAELTDPRRHGRLLVTVMGEPIGTQALGVLTETIAAHGGNIDRIERLASYPLVVLALQVSGAIEDVLRTALAEKSAATGLDVAVQSLRLTRRGLHLVVMDVDSTLIQDEVIELIAAHAGCEDQVREVTEAAMRGELDFAQSLQARVALLQGVPESALDQVRAAVRLTPGARTLCRTLKRLGYRIAVVSGGFIEVVQPLADDLEIDYVRANRLEVIDGNLTGRVVGDIVDRAGKAQALHEFAQLSGIPMAQTVAIGDGANDVDMISSAGLGIAFNAKPALRAAADASVNVPYLDSVLYLLGIPREEVEAADAADAC